jgi:hypothetical protein
MRSHWTRSNCQDRRNRGCRRASHKDKVVEPSWPGTAVPIQAGDLVKSKYGRGSRPHTPAGVRWALPNGRKWDGAPLQARSMTAHDFAQASPLYAALFSPQPSQRMAVTHNRARS